MTKNRLAASMAAAILAAGGAVPAAAAPPARSTAPIFDAVKSTKKNPRIVGVSTLTRDDNGLSFTIRTRGLTPGNAYTVWWIIKQKTNVKKDKMIAVHATGGVAAGSGETYFAGRIGVGKIRDARGNRAAVRFGGDFHDPRGATVMFAIVSHGPALPEMIHQRLTTRFGGKCGNAPHKKYPKAKPCKAVQRSLPHRAR